MIILDPKTQNGLQNDQKSIRFIAKPHMTFRHVGKPYKTCGKWGIWRAHFRPCGRPERAGRPAEPPIPGFLFLCRFLFFQHHRSSASLVLVLRTEVSKGDWNRNPPLPPLPWDSTVTSDPTLEYPSPRIWDNKGVNPERGSKMVPGNGTQKSPENAKIRNFADFSEFHKIPGILWNFQIFQKFQEFCNSGSLFGGMLRMLTKPMPFYRFFSSFSLKNHFFRKRCEFPEISAILVKFQEFHQILWNSPNSTNFGVLENPTTVTIYNVFCFKAKKVTLREVSRTSAQN